MILLSIGNADALAQRYCFRRPTYRTVVAPGVLTEPAEVAFHTTRFIVEEADMAPDAANRDAAFKIVLGTADADIVSRYSVVWSAGTKTGAADFDAKGGVIDGMLEMTQKQVSVQITVDFSPETDLEPVAKRFVRTVGANGLVFLFEAHTDLSGFFVDLKHYVRHGDYLVAEIKANNDTVRLHQRRKLLESPGNRVSPSDVAFYVLEDQEILQRKDIQFSLFGRFGGSGGRRLTGSPLSAYDDISLLEAYWNSREHAPALKIGLSD